MYKKVTNNKGLTVIVSPMDHMTSVSLGIWIGVGGRYETKKTSGISHLVEHMLFKGTFDRSAKELKQSIEGIGGLFNGFTSDEVTCYMVKVPVKYVERGIEVLSDMVLNAKFDENDIKKERFVVCEEIKMYKDQPADHVLDILANVMWPNNSLGQPLTGTISNVKSFGKKDLVNFRNMNYHPGNIGIVAAGKVNPNKFIKHTSDLFSGLKKKKKVGFKKAIPDQKGIRIKVDKRDIKQTHIAMGFHADGNTLRERFAFKLLNIILGGNMSSRLFEELREKRGLCYDISSSYKRHSDCGEMHVHAGVDNKNALRTISAVVEELQKVRSDEITEEELIRAKEYAKGQFLLAIESTSARMMWLGERYMVSRRIPEIKDILKNIDLVSPRDIKKASEKIFKGSLANLAMVGKLDARDKNKIQKELERL